MIVEFRTCETVCSLWKRRTPSGWTATLRRQCRHKSNSTNNAKRNNIACRLLHIAQHPVSGTPPSTLKLCRSLLPMRLFICHSDIEVIKHKISAKHWGVKIFSSACELISTRWGRRKMYTVALCALLLKQPAGCQLNRAPPYASFIQAHFSTVVLNSNA